MNLSNLSSRPGLKRLGLTLAAAPLLAAALPAAAAIQSVGASVQVNGAPINITYTPDVGSSADGGRVVVYDVRDATTSGMDVRAVRYDANGVAVRGVAVNAIGSGSQAYPAVAVGPAGNFAVAYLDGSTSGTPIRLARFDAQDRRLGTETVVTVRDGQGDIAGTQFQDIIYQRLDAGMDHNGGTVVVWQQALPIDAEQTAYKYQIVARRIDAAGTPRGPSFIVGQGLQNEHTNPAIAVAPDGGFAVVWTRKVPGALMVAVRARHFDRNGVGSAEFSVGNLGSLSSAQPRIAYDSAASQYVATWNSNTYNLDNVFFRRLNASGTVGSIIQVNDVNSPMVDSPDIACDVLGNCIVGWGHREYSGGVSHRLRRFGPANVVEGPSLRNSGNWDERLSVDADGDVVVVQSYYTANGTYAVHTHRYTGPTSTDLTLAQTVTSATLTHEGWDVTYTLTASNLRSPQAPTGNTTVNRAVGSATGVKIEFRLPHGITGTFTSGNQWTCTEFVPGMSWMDCYWNGVLRPATSTPALRFVAVMPSQATTIRSEATVKAEQFDANMVNNLDVDTTALH